MPLQLATLAQASVLQLRQALGRLTTVHAHADSARTAPTGPTAYRGIATLPRADLHQPEWAETSVDVRYLGA